MPPIRTEKTVPPAVSGMKHCLEGRREVLEVDVKLTAIIPRFKGLHNWLTIPFIGHASGDLFEGDILAGAQDVQERRGFKTVRLCADYTIEGTDYTGEKCRIQVQNLDTGAGWKPTLHTDSAALSALNDTECFAFVQQRGLRGPLVRIFAKL